MTTIIDSFYDITNGTVSGVFINNDITLTAFSARILMGQASTLSCCTQWSVGPVDFKSYRPPKKLLARICFLSPTVLRYIALQVDDVSLAVISFTVHDLLLCFLSIFRMADNVAARIV